MQKFKILIVENDLVDRTLIEGYIRDVGIDLIEYLAVAKSYDEALRILAGPDNFNMSVIDVKLGDGDNNGYKLIRSFPKARFGIVVFMSNEPVPSEINKIAQPVLQITKPFAIEDVINILSEMKRLHLNSVNVDNTADSAKRFVILDIKKTRYPVFVENIFCVHSDDKLTYFYYVDQTDNNYKRQSSNESLSSILGRLNLVSDKFVQCHSRWLVNLDHVSKISLTARDKEVGGEGLLFIPHRLCTKIPIGGRYKSDLEKRINLSNNNQY